MTYFISWHSGYCIRLTSSYDETLCRGKEGKWLNHWMGGAVELLQNGKVIHSFHKEFTDEQICLGVDQVDQVNDVFQVRCVSTDGVSIALIRPCASQF